MCDLTCIILYIRGKKHKTVPFSLNRDHIKQQNGYYKFNYTYTYLCRILQQ